MLNNPDFVSKLLDWSNNLYILAIVVTVLATFGVVYFGKIANRLKDAQVQQYQKEADARIATANATAESARKEAALAIKGAEGFRLDVAAANERVALAEKHAAEANERAKQYESAIASANARSSEAEKHAAEATLELAKFKAPRRLSVEQRARLKAATSPFAGQEFSMSVSTDPESVSLATVVEQDLVSSGWKMEKPAFGGDILLSDKWGIVITEGVKVQLAPSREESLTSVVIAVSNALKSAGIQVEANRNAALEPQPQRIHVIVGRKP